MAKAKYEHETKTFMFRRLFYKLNKLTRVEAAIREMSMEEHL